MNKNTPNVVRLLEQAVQDAENCLAQEVEIALTDAAGAVWCYRWTAIGPGVEPPKQITHYCKEVIQ